MGTGVDEVGRAVEWLRGTVKLLAVMPWLVAGVFLVLGTVVTRGGYRVGFVAVMGIVALASGFLLVNGWRELSRSDRPAVWGGAVSLAFMSGLAVLWSGLMVLLWPITGGLVWLFAVAVVSGLVVVAVRWQWRFHGSSANAAFGAVPRQELAESALEVPFHAPRSRIVLGIGGDALVVGSPTSAPQDREEGRRWADLTRVAPSEITAEDTLSTGRRTWKIKPGRVLLLRFADGEVWPIPADDPESLAALIRARAGLAD
ncbi:hypothetical protein AB0I60_00625 [Actinosynnema sp. NPDC050436]|uniref:hypothetical protein n=1 Tax=Actinosynnema sp. NPDC050436 TaxID=3155659 RepID=UPI00340AD99F